LRPKASLTEYKKKRHFETTPEPKDRRGAEGRPLTLPSPTRGEGKNLRGPGASCDTPALGLPVGRIDRSGVITTTTNNSILPLGGAP